MYEAVKLMSFNTPDCVEAAHSDVAELEVLVIGLVTVVIPGQLDGPEALEEGPVCVEVGVRVVLVLDVFFVEV